MKSILELERSVLKTPLLRTIITLKLKRRNGLQFKAGNLNKMSSKKLLLYLFFLIAVTITVKAQSEAPEAGIVQSDSSSCETNAAFFDFLANQMRNNNERLFVIAHLGKGETSRELNRRRLYNVRTYFKGWVDAKRFVFAEGENLSAGEGNIKFYIGSKLMLVSLVRNKKDICVDCCGPDDRYYGNGKIDKPKRKIKRIR